MATMMLIMFLVLNRKITELKDLLAGVAVSPQKPQPREKRLGISAEPMGPQNKVSRLPYHEKDSA